jgi:hypothetical protein
MLERASVDDLNPETAEAVRTHVAACARCRAALDELSAEGERFRASHPPEALRFALRAEQRRQRWRQVVPVLGAGLVAAAAVMLYLRPVGPPAIRTKGSGESLFRKRGTEVQLLEDGARIRAEDALRLSITTTEKEPVAAWFKDATGRIDPLGAPTELPPGQHELPGAAVVDAPCRDLELLVLRGGAATAQDRAAVARAFEAAERSGTIRRLRCE